MSATRPTAVEGAELVHALCEHIARSAGARALAIKGPIVAMQGLRAPRASADVDVLVHPVDLGRFVDAMLGTGWRHSIELTAPRVVPSHSVNLVNDHWPVGIDVHHFFPGFLAPADEVFEHLWARRTTHVLAGVPVTACDPVAMTAVVGLHLLRDDPEGTGVKVADLVARARTRLGPDGVAALSDLARATDSAVPLRPVLVALGVTELPETPAEPERLDYWTDRTRKVPGVEWGRQLRENPWWRWPRLAWRGVMLTDAEIDAYHGGDGTRRGRTRARVHRLGKLGRLAPGMVRGLRGTRAHR